MKIGRWKRRKYVPGWGGNREDDTPCVVVFAPPSVGWMSRWREIALQAPKIAREAAAAIEAGDPLPGVAWEGEMSSFRAELLAELILSVEELYEDDGKATDRDAALGFILDNPSLRDEVFQAILAEGQVSASEGKN